MKMLKLGVYSETLSEVNAENYNDYYSLLECTNINVHAVSLSGHSYHIISDDEAMLLQNPRISAIDRSGNILYMGNLLIAANDNGEIASLSKDDIRVIKAHYKRIATEKYPKGYPMLTNVMY